MISTKTIHSLPELDNYMASWDQFNPMSMSPTLHSDWVSSCAANFADDNSLYVLTANDHSQPVSIAPFCLCKRPVPHFELLGVSQLGEPADLLYHDATSLEHLISELIATKKPVLLHRLPAVSLAPAVFKNISRGHGLTITRKLCGYSYIDLTKYRNSREPMLSKKLKDDLRRALKKATDLGEISYLTLTPGNDTEAETGYQAYLQVETASWKGKARTALIYDEERNPFFHDLCRRAAQSHTLHIKFMLIDQQPVAATLSLIIDNRFWLLKTAYDDNYRRSSPGLLLIKKTLEDALQHGLASYEFLGHTEPWIKRWTTTERPQIKLTYYPYNMEGIRLFIYDAYQKIKRRFGTSG